jgi:exopolysaccharide production protein ExoZ
LALLPLVAGVEPAVAGGRLDAGPRAIFLSDHYRDAALQAAAAALGTLPTAPKQSSAGRGRIRKLAVFLGDASYSTYLSHVLVVSAIWRLGHLLPAQLPQIGLIVLSVIAANLVGAASYLFLEQPGLRVARRLSLQLFSRAAARV